MNVIPLNVPQRPRPAAPVRKGMIFLGSHAGLPIRIQAAGAATIAAVESGFRLSISVGTYSTLRSRPQEVPIREWLAMKEAAPRETVAEAIADVEWLADPSLATEGIFGAEHADVAFPSLEGAIAWVKEHCLRAPVPRISRDELDAWKIETVAVPDPKDPDKCVPMRFYDAVIKRFGPIYGDRIRTADLVRVEGLSEGDAEKIEAGVRKILPRRKP